MKGTWNALDTDAEICPLSHIVPTGLHEGDMECVGHRLNRIEVILAMPDAEICPLSRVVPPGLHEGDMECIGHTNRTVVSLAMPDTEICPLSYTVWSHRVSMKGTWNALDTD
jgi:hypothetical protein